MPYAAISETRRVIKGLHKARGINWFTRAEQEQYDVLCAQELVLLADLKSRGLPIPRS